eukprot:713808-Prymnesium_polylepis.1
MCWSTPNRRSRGRCAPTLAHRCARDSNPHERDIRSPRDRGACALRVQPHIAARTTANSPARCHMSLPSSWQSSQDDAERRRVTRPSCRSSSTIVSESGTARRRWLRGAGSARHTRCPRGCGLGGGFGGVASRRRLARW